MQIDTNQFYLCLLFQWVETFQRITWYCSYRYFWCTSFFFRYFSFWRKSKYVDISYLTLSVQRISERCIERKIKLNFYFHTSLWCLKRFYEGLKADTHLPKNGIICFNDSSSKMMKNAFYFTLKAFFLLKIFKFLSWLFGHVGKTAWLGR